MEECSQILADGTRRVTYKADTVSLPQTIHHRVEATSRLFSPPPPVSVSPDEVPLDVEPLDVPVAVDELTVYQRDEDEMYSEHTVEKKFVYDTADEVSEIRSVDFN